MALEHGAAHSAGGAAASDTGVDWGAVEARAAFLATVRLFERLPRPMLQDVASRLRPKQMHRSAFVFVAGEAARALSLLAVGQIKVIHETGNGRAVILRLIKPREIFGAAAGWGEPIYPASAVAQEPSVVLELPARDFTDLVRSQPHFALAVVRELGARLREMESRVSELQTERAECRLAHVLVRLAQKTGVETPAGIELGVTLTRQDLAELTGTTLSTTSRTMSAWDRQGIIAGGRDHLVIRQWDTLVAMGEDVPSNDGAPPDMPLRC
jgi:CRP-like cAMP-binding protein